MPIVRPILSLDLASLKDDFVHGYWEGAAVFYLSTPMKVARLYKINLNEMLLISCITHSLSLRQVERHYATNSLQLTMHVGKLQLIATSMASN
jgi:hypothetical protein